MNNVNSKLIKEEEQFLKRDFAFKRFFSKKGNEKYLKDFLEGLLKIEIRKIDVIPESKLIQRYENDKVSSMDLRVNINNEIIADIELQRRNEKNMDKRSLYYASRIISDDLSEKGKYENIHSVLMINILDYTYTDLPQYITETVIVDKNYRNYEVIKDIKFFFIELPKFRKSEKNINDKLTQWLALIDGTDKGVIEMVKRRSKIIKEADGEWEYLVGSAARKRMAELKLKWKLDYNSQMAYAREDGIEEGVKKRNIEIAKKLMEKGENINYISEITGLKVEEIKGIDK